jgi:DNA-binding NarL/FixJ family response regulator
MATTPNTGDSAHQDDAHQEIQMRQTIHDLSSRRHEASSGRLVPVAGERTGREQPIRVLLADGHGLFRAGLRLLIERQDGMCIAGEAASEEEAVAAAVELRPDVVLMDLDLPGLGGVAATRRIVGETSSRVVMLTTSETDDAVLGSLRAGASGLLPKDADLERLVDAIRAVMDGDVPLAPRLARRLVADFLARPQRLDLNPRQLEELTSREREVVALVASGLSNAEIAERLVVTCATAKTHVSRAMCKLNARDRARLVVLAYETGLVRAGPHLRDADTGPHPGWSAPRTGRHAVAA